MQKPLMSASATDHFINVPGHLAAEAYMTAASAARHLLPDGKGAGRTSTQQPTWRRWTSWAWPPRCYPFPNRELTSATTGPPTQLAYTPCVTRRAGRLRRPRWKSAPLPSMAGRREGQAPLGRVGVLHRMPVRAAHAGQLAGVMIPYWWILR
jgi:hypothetical protein